MPGGQHDLIGREDELEVLDDVLGAATRGQPAGVLIVGEAGVGKTTLVAEARRRAAALGFATATGGCSDGSTALPLAPLRGALHGLSQEVGAPFAALVAGRSEVASLLPGATISSDQLDAGRLYTDLLALLRELSDETPVLLVLEDLHWADRSTVELLSFLVRNLAGERLVLLITIRSEDLDTTTWSGQVLEELHRLPSVERLALGGLDRTDVASLAARELGSAPSPDEVDQLYERTAGNPFLASELAASGQLAPGRLPDSLRGVLELRLGRLGPSTARLVRVAAALDAPIDVEVLSAVLVDHEVEVEDEIRAALDAGVLQLRDGEPDFRHALLREAAYSQLLASERRRIHTAAKAAAEQRGASAGVVARHAERAGLPADALVAWLAAARSAATGFGKVDAPSDYARALALWDEVPDAEQRTGTTLGALLREAADASLAVGETVLGASFGEQALAATDPAADPATWADLALTLSELRWEQGRMADADELLDGVAQLVDPDEATAQRAWLLERRSFHALVRGEREQCLELGREAVAVADAADDLDVELYCLSGLGFALAVAGDAPAAIAALLDARDRADAAGLARPAVRAMIYLLVVLGASGDAPRAVAEGERGLEILARHTEALPNHGTIYALLARALLQTGDVARADEVLHEAPPVAGRLFQAYLAVARAELALVRGRVAEAARLLDGLEVELDANPYWAVQLSAVRADLQLAQGDPAAALQSAERLVELAEIWTDAIALRLRAAAITASLRVDPPLVRTHLAEARRRYAEMASAFEPADAAGWMHQVEALASDDRDEAAEHWTAAATSFGVAGHHLRALAAAEAATSTAPPAAAAAPTIPTAAAAPAPAGAYRFGDVEVDVVQFRVHRAGEAVHVEPQVLEVLAHLIEHRDHVVTKDELFEAVWGGPYVGEAALSSRIRDARKAVGDDGKAQRVIRTVHGRGYQFVAPLDP